MKKFCMIICSLMVAMAIAVGAASFGAVNTAQEEVTLCDMDYEFVSY